MGLTRIVPLKYWALDDLPPEIAGIAAVSPEGLVALPTEFRLMPHNASGLVFDTARWWSSHALGITHIKTENSESWSPHILLEHWEDCGEDGHLEFQLVGYAVLSDEQFQQYAGAARSVQNSWEFPQITMVS